MHVTAELDQKRLQEDAPFRLPRRTFFGRVLMFGAALTSLPGLLRGIVHRLPTPQQHDSPIDTRTHPLAVARRSKEASTNG